MKKTIYTLSTILIMSMLFIGSASYDLILSEEAEPATITRSNVTVWFDGNGTPVLVPDANLQIVFTNNNRGNVNVRAHGTLPEGSVLPDKAMKFTSESTGFVCGFGGTLEFKGVTTPSGQFSFTCKAP